MLIFDAAGVYNIDTYYIYNVYLYSTRMRKAVIYVFLNGKYFPDVRK